MGKNNNVIKLEEIAKTVKEANQAGYNTYIIINGELYEIKGGAE